MSIDKVENGFTVRYKRKIYVFTEWSDVMKFVADNEVEKEEEFEW